MPQESRLYFVPESEPFLSHFDELFTRFAKENKQTLVLNIHKDSVYNGEVGKLQEIILALQHQPQLIEKMLFCLEIRFTEVADSDLYLPEEYWKTDPAFIRWFNKLAGSPVMLFFINDSDARFFSLAGDLLVDSQLEVDEKEGMVGLGGEALQKVMIRLFSSCWWMLVYCHGSGFNPQPYIESLLADLDLPLTFEEVNEAFQEDLKKGINVRAVAQN